jgi:hypothetical protein
VLPQGIRGQRILSWGADHAYLASPANPTRFVRRWCRRWAPWLSETELAELVASTVDRNKRWSADQSAAVLEITVDDREALRFRFLGANDDPNYERRLAAQQAKAAASSRKYRAAHSTGAKRGRPALQLSEAERLEHTRAQGAKRAKKKRVRSKSGLPRGRPKSGKPEVWQAAGASSKSAYYRNSKKTATAQVQASGTQNASRKNASCHISKNIGPVTELSVTHFESHTENSRAPQAPRRLAPPCEVLEGEIILDDGDDDSGVALRAPPTNQRGVEHKSKQERWRGKVIDQDGNDLAPPPERRSPPRRLSNLERGREIFGGGRCPLADLLNANGAAALHPTR